MMDHVNLCNPARRVMERANQKAKGDAFYFIANMISSARVLHTCMANRGRRSMDVTSDRIRDRLTWTKYLGTCNPTNRNIETHVSHASFLLVTQHVLLYVIIWEKGGLLLAHGHLSRPLCDSLLFFLSLPVTLVSPSPLSPWLHLAILYIVAFASRAR